MKKRFASILAVLLLLQCFPFCANAESSKVTQYMSAYIDSSVLFGVELASDIDIDRRGAYFLLGMGESRFYFDSETYDCVAAMVRIAGTTTKSSEEDLNRAVALISVFEFDMWSGASVPNKQDAMEVSGEIYKLATNAVGNVNEFCEGEEIYFHKSDKAYYYVYPHVTLHDAEVRLIIMPK